jgi:hypothetical protein
LSFMKHSVFDINSIIMSKYQYSKPKLSYLIDNVLSSKSSLIFEPPYEEWLFLTIRGILDSKYFELLLYEDNLGPYKSSRFVGKLFIMDYIELDFVYSWLGNFTVDKSSKMVRSLEFYEKDRSDNFRL